MRHNRIFAACALGAAVVMSLAACSTAESGNADTVLRMGVVPTETAQETFNTWAPLVEKLEARTGYSVELFEATDLAAVVESTIAGDLDLVHLGPFAQVIARQNGADIATVGAIMGTPAGASNASVALVRDPQITDLSDLRGRDICFISPSSATGYLFGAAAFVEAGIDPERDINPIFVGDHASAVRTMWDGECAAVFTYREYGDRIAYTDNPDIPAGALTVVWSAEVPEAGISISNTLPDDVRDTLRSALLQLNGTAVLEAGECAAELVVTPEDGSGDFCGIWPDKSWGLQEKDDSYWEPVRVVCEETDAPACAA